MEFFIGFFNLVVLVVLPLLVIAFYGAIIFGFFYMAKTIAGRYPIIGFLFVAALSVLCLKLCADTYPSFFLGATIVAILVTTIFGIYDALKCLSLYQSFAFRFVHEKGLKNLHNFLAKKFRTSAIVIFILTLLSFIFFTTVGVLEVI